MALIKTGIFTYCKCGALVQALYAVDSDKFVIQPHDIKKSYLDDSLFARPTCTGIKVYEDFRTERFRGDLKALEEISK